MGKFNAYANNVLAKMDKTPLQIEMDIKFDFIDIITKQMAITNINQKTLADMIGMKASQLSRILNAEENITFRTAAKMLSCLKIKLKLNADETQRCISADASTSFKGKILCASTSEAKMKTFYTFD